jgi:hypothetical protein
VHHVDAPGAQRDRPAHRDRVHDAAVEEVLVTDAHRRQQPRDRARREDGVDERAVGEPALRGGLDARGHAPEGHGEILDALDGQRLGQQAAQRGGVVEMGARPRERAEPAQSRAAEHVAALELRPRLRESRHRAR